MRNLDSCGSRVEARLGPRDLLLAAALSLFALLLVGSALGLVADSSIPTGLVLALGIIILVPIPLDLAAEAGAVSGAAR